MITFDIGAVQAAIWHTEEAIEIQRERIAVPANESLAEIAMRSLASLEDLLGIQQRMLDLLLAQTTPTDFGLGSMSRETFRGNRVGCALS